MQQVHFTMHAEGVTQEQCAGMMTTLLNWQAPPPTTLCMQQCQNGLKQTLVEAWLEQTSSTSQSNARPSQITLHIMSHQTCASRPSQHLQLRYCSNRATSTVTAVSSSKPCEHLHARQRQLV
jgi:hypothetical protein